MRAREPTKSSEEGDVRIVESRNFPIKEFY
jgi:hypothetical protein